MFIVAGLDACPGVRSVLCLHETVCTGAADGFGRMNRRPACTLLHLGPGLANGIANLHNARRARSPVINLVGDMATWHSASHDAPLCMDVSAIAATVGCVITCGPEPEQVGRHVARAIAATTVPASSLASRVGAYAM
jgi:acetolactate synthase I/II/III large subunit